MKNGKWKRLMLVATAGAMALLGVSAAAQTLPSGALPRSALGMTGPVDHTATIRRRGIGDPALKLTARQRAQIDDFVSAYVTQQQVLAEQQPITPGVRPSEEAIAARRRAFDQLSITIGNTLNSEQRKVWQNAQMQRQAQMDA